MYWRRVSAVVTTATCAAAGFAVRAAVLVAAAFLAHTSCAAAAAAPEPIALTVSGRLNQWIFVRDDTDDPRAPAEKMNPVGQFTYSRLTFDGRARLSDTLTARANIRFIANTRQPDNVDEAFVELSGPFGRVQLGDRQAANTFMIESVAPQAFLHMNDEIVASVVRPRSDITMRDGLTFKRYTRASTGFVYQSPRWNTLDIGVGYYPGGDTPINTVQRVRGRNATETTVSSVGNFSDTVRYRLLTGYYQAELPQFPDKISAWNVMADLFVGPVEIGATVMHVAPLFGLREVNWAAGAMYFQGPWRVSADFRQAERERESNDTTYDKVERLTFQISYRLAPGINVGASAFTSFQRDPLAQIWRSRGALVGMTVAF